MFKRHLILGLLCTQLTIHYLQAELSVLLNQNCFLESCVSCNTPCDIDQIKCPNDHGDIFNKTFFAIRPQDSNAARRIMVGKSRSELFYQECFCTKINLTLEWQQSFNDSKLAKWFSFNCNKCMTMGIPGNGQTFDINGTQFGVTTTNLLPGPIGTICLKPRLQNFIADLDVQINLDDWWCGLWARVDVPLVWARTNIGLHVLNENSATNTTFPAGFFTIDCSTTPVQSITEGLASNSCGKFSKHALTKVGIAGIHLDFGYDFIRNECGNLGVSLHLVTPTGTRPKSRHLFEPIIGANRCFQVGTNVNAQYSTIFDCSCDDITLSFMLDATLTHLFKSTQTRLFGLKGHGPGSSFLLLKQFNAIGTAVVDLTSVANALCGKTKIGNDFMFDGAFMMQISGCNFFSDIGYNFWYRSKEKRSRRVCFRNFDEMDLGIKGNQFISSPAAACPTGCLPTCISDITTANNSTLALPAAPDALTTFIDLTDIDFCIPLHPQALSHKVFGSIGYTWDSCNNFYELLIGGEVEFGQHNRALNQWGVLIKGGIAF